MLRFIISYRRPLTLTPTAINLEELRDAENALYDISRQSSDPTDSQVWFPLYAFGRYMHSVSADLWEELLDKHVANTSVHLDANDTVVLVQSSRLLTALDKLFKAYAAKPERLLEGIAWVFMQMFLWTMGDIRRLKFGDVTPQLAPHVCAVFVESRVGMRAAALSVRNRFNSSVRAEFNSFVRGLVKTLRSSLKNLPWIDKGALRKPQHKLSNLTVDMFPTEEFFTADGLAELYADFAAVAHKSEKLSFIEYFTLYSDTLRRYLGSKRYEDVYRRRLTDVASQLTEYLYWPNLLRVSMAALQPPLHSLDGTYSMNFGGLGSYLMRELSRSFDMAGAFADTQGSATGSWGPNKTSDYKGKVECYHENFETGDKESSVAGANASNELPVELFSDLPALEAAFSAYTQALAETGDDVDVVQLPYLESYSGHQIFFLTYCHVMCGRSRHNAGRCNLPLRNFLPFAKAFRCPVGSAMNPAKKCSFFENSLT
ncbi:hypothetical protein HPB48_001770 [Haemaphysalis longicornis]|uniref:Uncharacterized protein n=1 Tax=Haemaphysalis longicornis TaxID=44386 RepID=A0A9J6GP77_HAELO|nr:hypothetical protein HPB48_001770 [Haemaphysalis longicornis]